MENLTNTDTTTADTGTVIDTASAPSDDAALGAVFDQFERDNGSARDEAGKFTNANGAEASDGSSQEGEETGEVQANTEVSSPSADPVPLPANWRGRGMESVWGKIPADVQAQIAQHDAELHTRMSEQGRQIAEFRPYSEVFERNKDLLSGKTMPDGTAPTMLQGVDFLFSAQRRLDQNPIAGLIEIADRYGVRQHLAAALSGQIEIPADRQSPALTASDIAQIVREMQQEETVARSANEEVSRLAKDKPLYSEIAEDDMVHAIHKARSKLGDAASHEAVFDLAYDMAVNADPDLRKKAAAATKAAAAEEDPKRTADARRATSVNVTSTTTGKSRQLTEDELLGQAYDEAQNKG